MDPRFGRFLDRIKWVLRTNFQNANRDEESTYSPRTSARGDGLSPYKHDKPQQTFMKAASEQTSVFKKIDASTQTADDAADGSADMIFETQHLVEDSNSTYPCDSDHTPQEHLAPNADSDDTPLWNDAPRKSAPLLENRAEIALATHEGRARLALFLGPAFILDIANVVGQRRTYQPLEKKFGNLEREIERIEDFLGTSDEMLHDVVTEDRRQEIAAEIQNHKEQLEELLQQRKDLRDSQQSQREELNWLYDALFDHLVPLLEDEGLIAPEEQSQPIEADQIMDDAASIEIRSNSDHNAQPEEEEADPELAAQHSAEEEALARWHAARSALCHAHADFEGQDIIKENMLREYRQNVEFGKSVTGYPEDDEGWDHLFLVQGRDLTRALIDAEDEEKEAFAGVCLNGGPPSEAQEYMESNFPDQSDDGYNLSFEAEMKDQIDLEKVEKWRNVVLDCTKPPGIDNSATISTCHDQTTASHGGLPGSSPSTAIVIDGQESPAQLEKKSQDAMDIDDWSAESLAFGESLSTIWPQERTHHERVGKWHAVCEEMRPQFADRILGNDIRSAIPFI